MRLRLLGLSGCLFLGACTGTSILAADPTNKSSSSSSQEEPVVDPSLLPPDLMAPEVCTGAALPVAPLRRLSHVEYRHSLEDLLGNAALAETSAAMLVRDPSSLGFSNSAILL